MCNQRSRDMILLSFHLLKHSVDTQSPTGFFYPLDCQQNKISGQSFQYVGSDSNFIGEKKQNAISILTSTV